MQQGCMQHLEILARIAKNFRCSTRSTPDESSTESWILREYQVSVGGSPAKKKKLVAGKQFSLCIKFEKKQQNLHKVQSYFFLFFFF